MSHRVIYALSSDESRGDTTSRIIKILLIIIFKMIVIFPPISIDRIERFVRHEKCFVMIEREKKYHRHLSFVLQSQRQLDKYKRTLLASFSSGCNHVDIIHSQ